MLSLDILICTLNTRVVRVADLLMPEQEGVHYVISFQYTSDELLKLVPESILERKDVTFVKLRGEGISANRNNALRYAKSDLVYWADDDVRFLPETVKTIFDFFTAYPDIDVALFRAQTYSGRELRQYESMARECLTFRSLLPVLTIEKVCRREKIQNQIYYNTHSGLGAHFMTCYEEQIWLEDAKRLKLKIYYIPKAIIQTSALYLTRLIFVDVKVQRSFGALLYYVYGLQALRMAFIFSFNAARKRMAHFDVLFRQFLKGILYMRKYVRKNN